MKVENVIIVCDFPHISGGAEKVAVQSAIGLAKRGLNVIFFSAVLPVCEELRHSSVKVICLGQYDILHDPNRFRAIIQGLYNKKAKSEFETLLKMYDPSNTIVHFHEWSKVLSPVILDMATTYKYPIVITSHDFFIVCPNGGFYQYPHQKICGYVPLSLKCILCNCDSRSYYQKIWRLFRSLYQRYVLKRNRRLYLITISELTKRILEPLLENLLCKCYRLDNPVDINHNELVSIKKNKYYLFMGRLSKEKGVGLFCRAITELNLKGCVLGDGYMMKELKLNYPNITFTGWVTGTEKEKWIRKSKAFVFPSVWYEGAPLSVIEMKSYGLPCIVPDRCAASEQIEDGKDGYIFHSGDLNSLKEAIRKYEEADISKMQDYLYETFHPEDYALHTHINRLCEIYGDILR